MEPSPVAEKRRAGQPRKPRTLAGSFGSFLVASALSLGCGDRSLTWPSPKYQSNPVGFAHEVLGIKTHPAMVEFLEAVRDHRAVTWRSGHKTGKTTSFAVAALWFYCSYERACVPLTATKSGQIDAGVWKELRRLYRLARIPIGGELHLTSRAGLYDPNDERKIWGVTSQKGEGAAGIGGPNVLVLVDEASGLHDIFFEVLGTSIAASGGTVRKAYAGNPTRTSGAFYRSHTTEAKQFYKIHTSSEDTPNARGATGDDIIPGLAGPEWIAEMRVNPGEKSAIYAVRVRGDFCSALEGKIIGTDLVAMAESAWDHVKAEGQLQIGIDPAGDKSTGDEVAIAVRRGMKISTVIAWPGLTVDGIVENALGLIEQHRIPREPKPRVAIDAEGGIGAELEQKLKAHLALHPEDFELVAVRSGRKAWGSPTYDLIHGALWGSTRDWLEAGGVIPTDTKLREDLNAPSFTYDKNKRLIATDKKILRKTLGRSTDRGDAVSLSIWGHASVATELEDEQAQAQGAAPLEREDEGEDFDRFAPDRIFDPYAGAG